MPDCARLFVGTFLSDQEIATINSIKNANLDLSAEWNIRARFVLNEKLHMTWLFLGNVERSEIPKVENALQTAILEWKTAEGGNHLEVQYDQTQVWPSLDAPRVLVLEATKNLKSIRALNKSINNHLQAFCQSKNEVERYDVFRPHLTICRFSPNKGANKKNNRSMSEFNLPENALPFVQRVSSVTLIESDLDSQAVENLNLPKGSYRILSNFGLGQLQ
jgi:2'-5' RNA ligase